MNAQNGIDSVTALQEAHANGAIFRARRFVELFDSGEHVFLGDRISLQGLKGKTTFSTKEKAVITFGQLIALAGDFYGVPDQVISDGVTFEDRQTRFDNACATLLNAAATEVNQLLGVFRQELDAVSEAISQGLPPSAAYSSQFNARLDKQYTSITGLRYVNLAYQNLDHFGKDAIAAYQAGHSLALKLASQKRLEDAYFYDGFACHFLTDLFSAGHIRTPRRAIWNSAVNPGTAGFAGLCTRKMHDEDCRFGLYVNNARGNEWLAYGDARLRDLSDTANELIAVAAVQASVDEVYVAYTNDAKAPPDPEDYRALTFIPNLESVADRTCRRQLSPLYAVELDGKGTIVGRKERNDLSCYNHEKVKTWPTEWAWMTSYYKPQVEFPFLKLRPAACMAPDFANIWLGCSAPNVAVTLQAQKGEGFIWDKTTRTYELSLQCAYYPLQLPGDVRAVRFLGVSSKSFPALLSNYGEGWDQFLLSSFDAASGPIVALAWQKDQSEQWVYRSEMGITQVQFLGNDDGDCYYPIAKCKAPPPDSDPAVYVWQDDPNGETLHIIYTSLDGAIIDTYSHSGGKNAKWEFNDITNSINGPKAILRPSGASWPKDPLGSSQVIAYKEREGGLPSILAYRPSQGWTSISLPPSEAPVAAMAPLARVAGEHLWVIYVGFDGRLYASKIFKGTQGPQSWSIEVEDITSAAGAVRCASNIEVLASPTGEVKVYFFDVDGNLIELSRSLEGGWTSINVTAQVGFPKLAAPSTEEPGSLEQAKSETRHVEVGKGMSV